MVSRQASSRVADFTNFLLQRSSIRVAIAIAEMIADRTIGATARRFWWGTIFETRREVSNQHQDVNILKSFTVWLLEQIQQLHTVVQLLLVWFFKVVE